MRRLGDSGTQTGGETLIASAATTDLGTSKTRNVAITGTTTITSFGTGANREALLRFAGVLTLTYNATSLILPGLASIITAAGDTALATSDAAGNWRIRDYTRNSAPVQVFGSAGLVALPKIWQGEVTTTSTGAWSVDLSAAGFTAAPRIFVMAVSADTTVANSAEGVVTARSATAASGFINLQNTVVVGGLGEKRAGAGLTVMVMAIGP